MSRLDDQSAVGDPEAASTSARRRRKLDDGGANSKKLAEDHVAHADLVKLKCLFCRRDGTATNPCPDRHDGKHFAFLSKVECKPCSSYIKGCLSGVEKMVLRQTNRNQDSLKEYMVGLNQHEELFNRSAGQQIRGARDLVSVPSWVKQLEETVLRAAKTWTSSGLRRS
jgi:hypothetical protein